MKNLQSYLGIFDFYIGKSSELPAEPSLSADKPIQVASKLGHFHMGHAKVSPAYAWNLELGPQAKDQDL
jgi:hypothetical protein